ncbi:MAG: peptide-N-glycosidase F-related protein [Crocinitomicaceae bacterium]
MNKILLILTLILFSFNGIAQDTTWVQTFTYDSISSRRAKFDFPASLQGKRFEKVLMYYNIKCSPLTTWDSYNCGEWDYLTYSQIYQHTGVLDSVQKDGNAFLANLLSPNSIKYRLAPYYNVAPYNYTLNAGTPTWGDAVVTSGTGVGPLKSSLLGQRYQFIVTAAEITAAGFTSGDAITGLSFNINTAGGDPHHVIIKGALTIKDTLAGFIQTGLQQLYEVNTQAMPVGAMDILFNQTLTWDGTSNVVFEVQTDAPATSSDYILDMSSATNKMSASYDARNGVFSTTNANNAIVGLSNYNFQDEITVVFWAKGNANSGVNTSVLEALDSLGNRVLNIHFPWSDNTLYFDAGDASGYDRVSKAMAPTEIQDQWNQWTFVKKQSTGEMFVYKNGVLWTSGTAKTRMIGTINQFILGGNAQFSNNWGGKIDEFQIWNKALDAATIATWYNQKITPAHPNYANLLVCYDFDNQKYAEDKTGNNYLLMPSQTGMINFTELPVVGVNLSNSRPAVRLTKDAPSTTIPFMITDSTFAEPQIVFEYTPQGRKFVIQNQFPAYMDEVAHPGNITLNNSPIVYYQKPFEVVNNFEIGRYITPYGINFDLGPKGFTYLYDVTDYQSLLMSDTVDFAAHNTQELINVKFAFIEGIPSRDIVNFQEIWKWGSFLYKDLDNNTQLKDTSIVINPAAEMFKIRTRITGHGQVGNGSCCEWADKKHSIYVDGTQRFAWNIWKTSECGDNPNTGQGGTWPYAREGWCPGDIVTDVEHEVTPFVTPGSSSTFDYKIDPVPSNDQAQETGNFIVSAQLMSYSAPNFQNDGAIIDVLNPNNWEYYGKFNANCSSPRVIIQNNGSLPLTQAKIRLWVTDGTFQDYQWTGNLAFLQKETVEIPIDNPMSFWTDYQNEHTFHAKIYNVNSTSDLDEYANNSVFKSTFDYPITMPETGFLVWFKTNNKPNENSYKLMDDHGNTIFERAQGSLAASTEYKDTFMLAPGCYSVIINDTDGDGLSFWYSAQVEGETAGFFRLKRVFSDGGPTITTLNADFGFYSRLDFSVGFQLGITENEKEKSFNMYPNPNNGSFRLEATQLKGSTAEFVVTNLMGQTMYSTTTEVVNGGVGQDFNLNSLVPGQYMLRLISDDGVIVKPFIIE